MRILLVLFCLLWALPLTATGSAAVPRGQLPKQVVPTSYQLELWMDPRADRFSGTVRIQLDVRESTSSFWLHARESTLTDITFDQAGTSIPAKAERVLDEAGLVRIDLDKAAGIGAASMAIRFDAPYNLRLEGAYKVTAGGEPYVMTQMEPLGARNAFPCFDEPAFKTTWDISIVAPRSDTAITNTREIALEKVKDGWARHVFAQTRPLPSYLIAFAVGPWELREFEPIPPSRLRAHPIPLRGVAAKGQSERMTYMLGETAKIVAALEEYFDYPYPYDKLDLLAAPDFGYGAMENAGLITYRDSLMFASPEQATSLRRGALSTHIHELGHQWFGNLVTMPWWDDLWLNEAFATWTEGRITTGLYPELSADMDMVAGGIDAMGGDSLASSRRIHNPITDYTDVASAFDGITYQKGGAVLTMFERFLGPDAFRAALRAHMRKFEFGNATSTDLAESFAAQSPDGDKLRSAFASFTDQPGVPMLDVRVECKDSEASLKIRQSRYQPIGATFADQPTWQIPFCARVFGGQGGSSSTSTTTCAVIDTAEASVPLGGKRCPEYVQPNADGAGYYRFRLDKTSQSRLVDAFDQLNDAEQLTLADSLNAALGAGQLAPKTYLDAAPVFAQGRHADVVAAPFDSLAFLHDQVAEPRQKRQIESLLNKHWGKRLRRMGLEHGAEDDEDTMILRTRLIGYLIAIGRPKWLLREMAERGRSVLGDDQDAFNPKAVHPDFLRPALYAAVFVDGAPAIKRIQAHLAGTEDSIHRSALLGSLSAAESAELFESVLATALDKNLKSSELIRIVFGLTANADNHPALWAWIKAHDSELLNRVPAVFKGRLAAFGSAVHCSNEGAAEIQAFYGDRVADLEGGPRSLAQSVESVRLCAARVKHLRGLW